MSAKAAAAALADVSRPPDVAQEAQAVPVDGLSPHFIGARSQWVVGIHGPLYLYAGGSRVVHIVGGFAA